jgi:hypothetical protein
MVTDAEEQAIERDLFSLADIQRLFGEPGRKVRAWIRDGLFEEIAVQLFIPRRAVRRFIREHASKYRLSAVEQRRFVELLFGPVGVESGRKVRK